MFIRILFWLTAFPLLFLSVTAGPWYKLWPFEMLGTGYLWFAAFTLIGLGMLLLKRRPPRRNLILVFALALGFYATTIGTWYIPRLQNASRGGTPLAVMTYNVNYRLWDTTAVTGLVRENPVDIVGLIEPFQEQAAELRDRVQDLYPYYYRATGGGLSLFSRYPIAEAATENLGTRYHSLFAIVDVDGRLVRLVVAHPLAPVSPSNFRYRNQAMVALASYGARQSIPTVIMGDFNLTSWSLYFRHFIRASGLRSVTLGHGLNPTWFYNDVGRSLGRLESLKQILKIPIDHIFISKDVNVAQVNTPAAGISDHRPVIAKLRLK